MSDKNTGVSAFPVVSGNMLFAGMTLRDYFAAKAMQGVCTNADTWGLQADSVALEAYAMADAMLRARENS